MLESYNSIVLQIFFEEGESPNRRKLDGCFFAKFCGKIWVGFWKRFSEKQKAFFKNWSTFFSWKYYHGKSHGGDWGVQCRPITKSAVLPLTTLFFRKIDFSIRTSSWFNVLITQVAIFILFVSASVLIVSTFSLWVSLNLTEVMHYYWKSKTIAIWKD